MNLRLAILSVLTAVAVMWAGRGGAQSADARDELAALAKRVASIEAYSVSVSISVSDAEKGPAARAMRIDACRDGDQFAYRSGPIEILWARRGVLVVNHVSRTIILREPLRREDAPAELAAALSYDRLTSSSVVQDVSVVPDVAVRRLVIRYTAGPLLRTEIETDPASGLPSAALLVYRPGGRAPSQVAMVYRWNVSQPASAASFDDARFLAWEGDSASLQPGFKHYRLVRVDGK